MEGKKFTLITGASRGLGKCLAEACAKRHMNLLLVALPGEGIHRTAALFSDRYGVCTKAYETDLTHDDELQRLSNEINRDYAVNILINNAGTGGTHAFQSVSIQYIDTIVFLNIRALVILTHNLLPNLRKHSQSYILNIASLASFGPMPFKTIYPASKAFVYSFSRGLYAELRGSNVFVSVAHPGGMATNPDTTKRINRHGWLVRSTILPVEKTAEISIRRLLQKDSLIIPGIMNKISWLFFKLTPVWLRLWIFSKALQKEITDYNRVWYAD